jgi:hypothetical protein
MTACADLAQEDTEAAEKSSWKFFASIFYPWKRLKNERPLKRP